MIYFQKVTKRLPVSGISINDFIQTRWNNEIWYAKVMVSVILFMAYNCTPIAMQCHLLIEIYICMFILFNLLQLVIFLEINFRSASYIRMVTVPFNT